MDPGNYYINFMPEVSLQNIAIVKLVGSIWKEPDLRGVIERHVNEKGRMLKHSDELYVKVQNKLSRIPLPTSMADRIEYVLFRVGREIIDWIGSNKFFSSKRFFDEHLTRQQRIQLIDSLCFTFSGRIDVPKTLEAVLDNQQCSDDFVTEVYTLACLYCNKTLVTKLWNSFPENTNALLKRTDTFDRFSVYDIHYTILVPYWSCVLSNDLKKFSKTIAGLELEKYDPECNLYENILNIFQFTENVYAMQYMWRKNEEMVPDPAKWTNKALEMLENVEMVIWGDVAESTFFLLSQIKDLKTQYETTFFKECTGSVLTHLFRNWPLQKFLLPTVRFVQDFVSGSNYVWFINDIVDDIRDLKSKYAESVFRDVWSLTSTRLKGYLFENSILSNFIFSFLWVGDYDSPNLIINDASAHQKERIFTEIFEIHSLSNYIKESKLDALEKLMKKTLGSDEDVMKCKVNSLSQFFHTDFLSRNHFDDFLTEDEAWDISQTFLHWCFSCEEDIEVFKQKLDKVTIIESLTIPEWPWKPSSPLWSLTANISPLQNYTLVEKFLDWCCYPGELCGSQKAKPNIVNFIETIRTHEYKLLDKVLDWCCESKDEAKQLKKRLAKDECSSILKLFCTKYNFESYKDFIAWCFDSTEEVDEFKAFIASEKMMIHEMMVAYEINFRSSIEFTDELNMWCRGSPKIIA